MATAAVARAAVRAERGCSVGSFAGTPLSSSANRRRRARAARPTAMFTAAARVIDRSSPKEGMSQNPASRVPHTAPALFTQ